MFSNLVVIDLSTVLAGPSVGTFFAELGARVIKVENPKVPDVTRSWKLGSEEPTSSVSAYFSSINYKKEYLQLDLKNNDDYQQFLELISKADIFLSNFKLGDDVKFNIQDTVLRAVNPRLICGKITGFGDESDRVAYDLILQAETGFMSMNGTVESGPVKMPVALIDVLAAHHLKEALLLALLERSQKGVAKTVSVSLYDAAVASLANQASNYLMEGKIPQRIGSLHPNIAPYGEIFETKDKALITFAIGSDMHFQKLCAFLTIAELSTDPKFASNVNRVQHRTELQMILQDKLAHYSSEEVLANMLENNVPCGKIKNLEEVFNDASAKELIRSEQIEGKETKRVTSLAFKWK